MLVLLRVLWAHLILVFLDVKRRDNKFERVQVNPLIGPKEEIDPLKKAYS